MEFSIFSPTFESSPAISDSNLKLFLWIVSKNSTLTKFSDRRILNSWWKMIQDFVVGICCFGSCEKKSALKLYELQ